MHRSPRERRHPSQTSDTLKDERPSHWHPDRISDRKLIELNNRLDKVRRLGDAFADLEFSPPLQQRLHNLTQADPNSAPEVHVITGRPSEPAR